MQVVMVASECGPVAKVGGLADVVAGLGQALEANGQSVEIILPKYDCMRYDHVQDLQVVQENLAVGWYGGEVDCTVFSGRVQGLSCCFIEPHDETRFFDRRAFYGFPDDHLRFGLFAKAALEFLRASGRRPDVIHTHEWHVALLPVMLREMYAAHGLERSRVCHTIHDFRYQGVVGEDLLAATGLERPDYYRHPDRLQDDFNPSALNMTKGAVNYADFVTTVSPRHAVEVLRGDQGWGLAPALERRGERFAGVLNGIDYGVWNPAVDPLIPHAYSADDFDGKYGNKKALRDRLLLCDDYKPILAYVGRMDGRKGVHLIRHALYYALEHGTQFVLLGASVEPGINEEFWRLKHELNDNPDCHLELAFDENLAHLIYAGADMIVAPSLQEPCGLTQMVALRYGAVPVVRAAGGLADTVFDRDYSERPAGERNGYLFNDADYPALESALHRAVGLWYSFPGEFRQLARQGMRCDYSWHMPAARYLDIYQQIRQR